MKYLMITVIIVIVLMASFAGCSRLENFSTDSSAATVSSRTNEAPTVVISIDKNTLAAITESTAVISTDTFSQTQPNWDKPAVTTTRIATTSKPTTTKPIITTTNAYTTTTTKARSDPWVYPYDPGQIYKDAKAYALSIGLRWMDSLTKDNAHWVTPLSTVPWTNDGMTKTLEEKVYSEISEIKGFGIYTAMNLYMEPDPEDIGDYYVYYLLG